jgi:uncharacterized protein (DUF1778 family)
MAASSATSSKDRMHFRLDPKVKERVVRAAAISGQGLTNFAVSALVEKAEEILQRHNSLVLSDEESKFFLESLSEDKKPSRHSLAAAKRYRAGTRKGVRYRLDH